MSPANPGHGGCFWPWIGNGIDSLNFWMTSKPEITADDLSAFSRPFWLILFLHCTTSVLLGYCQDDRPSMCRAFLSDSVVRNDVVVVGKLFVADRTYSSL